MKLKKIIIIIISGICVLAGIYFLIAFVMVQSLISGYDKDFKSNLWKDDYEGERRTAMVDDLEKKYLKKGMTKEEVIQLLGEPDGRHPDGKNYTWNKRFDYDLGNNGWDPCEFSIRFDENQQVVSWDKLCS